ncbi:MULTISPECIES: pitrilysin family protein [unclassified Streptococcus]|uniref:EF-P 5-aminopentanol modification-associated protein YfmH n=1 Tax=unclassified Streptococcus TaxID=2608887 RepID=UPI001072D145|nr:MULTISPECIES: pitrilysin family protein [unclassified Streptococcus]MBF0806585.1 insulinase family protein [Streptococcus sp. 19428wA2_WM07]TFU27342.1 insulinase family protein [Streptococcus sp. WM07]
MRKLEEKRFSSIDETLFTYRFSNGFLLRMLPKKEFKEQAGLLTVNIGSLDWDESEPAGLPHFLEHKIFETESGEDFLLKFTESAIDSNAFTSFGYTGYTFSSSKEISASTRLLLEMISSFTTSPKAVDKEKEIILQELEMYKADPDQVLYTEALARMYPHTPLAMEIVGSRESISQINLTDLQRIYRDYYQAQNMQLFLIGDFDPVELIELLEDSVLRLSNQTDSRPLRNPLSYQSVKSGESIRMDVSKAKLAIGLRGNQSLQQEEIFVYKVKLQLFFSLLLGWTSQRYQDLLDSGKIDYSFQFEIEVQELYHHVFFFLDTDEPVSFSHQLRTIVKRFEQSADLSEEHLDLLKNEMYGDFIRQLDHYDFIFNNYLVGIEGLNLFDLPAILPNIHLVDVLEVGREFIETCDMMDFTVLPNYT